MNLPPLARRRTGALLALVLAGAALGAAAPPAPADPTYPASPATIVDGITDQFLAEVAIAVDPADRTTLVYEDAFREQPGANGLHAIRIAANGTVGPSQPIKDKSLGFESIDVAADSKGNAVIVWQRSLGNSTYIAEYARMNAAGAVSSPMPLTADGKTGGSPRVAIDSLDRAHIVWTETDGMSRVKTAMLDATGAMAVQPHFISQAGKLAQTPQLGIDGADAVTIAWRLSDSAGVYVQTTRLDAGGGWDGTVETVGYSPLFASLPAVAAGPDGRSTVVWTQRDDRTEDVSVRARRLAADGSPVGTVHTLSAAGANHDGPVVEIDKQNRSVVVWSRADAAGAQIKSRRIRGDGTLETLQSVTPTGDPSIDYEIAVDSSNRTVVTWIHGNLTNGNDRTVRTRRLGNDGVPEGQPVPLSGLEARGPVLAIASSDRPVHAWQRDPNPDSTVLDDRIEMIVGTTTPVADDGDPGDGDPGDGDPGDGDPGSGNPGGGGSGGSGQNGGSSSGSGTNTGVPTAPTAPANPLPTPLIRTPAPAPTGQATARPNQPAGGPLQVRVVSTADGFVTVSATQIVRFSNGRAVAAAQTKTLRLKLRSLRKAVRAGQPVTLVLRPTSRKQAAALRRAAKRATATATATVKLEFQDRAGRRTVRTLRVKLR